MVFCSSSCKFLNCTDLAHFMHNYVFCLTCSALSYVGTCAHTCTYKCSWICQCVWLIYLPLPPCGFLRAVHFILLAIATPFHTASYCQWEDRNLKEGRGGSGQYERFNYYYWLLMTSLTPTVLRITRADPSPTPHRLSWGHGGHTALFWLVHCSPSTERRETSSSSEFIACHCQ